LFSCATAIISVFISGFQFLFVYTAIIKGILLSLNTMAFLFN
jgi:hypothetical protein